MMGKSLVVLFCGLLSACGGAQSNERGEREVVTREVRYRITVADDLRELRVSVCFRGDASTQLLPLNSNSPRFLLDSDQPLEGRVISLDAVGSDSCTSYRVDLVTASSSRFGGFRSGYVTSNPTTWLWYPSGLALDVPVRVQFEAKQGIDVAVPWAREGDGYRLDPATIELAGNAVFGRFARETLAVPGGELDVVTLDGELDVGREGVREWLSEAARAVSLVGGRFPRERALVIVVPAGFGFSPVAFGMVRRGGGASVVLFPYQNAQRAALIRDWVAVHEFSHLWMPRVAPADVWISEGVATYLQEVLRARAGMISGEQAFANLARGFRRQREEYREPLAEASRRMRQTRGYQRIYWSGAAFAMIADVRLRQAGTSLEEALARSSETWSERSLWGGVECVAQFDRGRTRPIVQPLARRLAASRSFPSVRAEFSRLGVLEGDSLTFTDAALADIRDAMVASAESRE